MLVASTAMTRKEVRIHCNEICPLWQSFFQFGQQKGPLQLGTTALEDTAGCHNF